MTTTTQAPDHELDEHYRRLQEAVDLTATTEPYVLHLVHTNVHTRWPCTLCPGSTEKTGLLWHFIDDDGDEHDVCDECVEAGVDALPVRLRRTANRHHRFADDLEALAGKPWRLPVRPSHELRHGLPEGAPS